MRAARLRNLSVFPKVPQPGNRREVLNSGLLTPGLGRSSPKGHFTSEELSIFG